MVLCHLVDGPGGQPMTSTVNDVLMEWGSWRLDWRPDVPTSIRAAADTERYPFSPVKIFDAYVDADTAKILKPLWTGLLVRSDAGSIGGPGPAWLAGTGGGSIWKNAAESGPWALVPLSRTTSDGSLANWLNDITVETVSGLGVGYVGGSGVKKAGTLSYHTARTMLDSFIAPAFQVDWRVNSAFQLEAGTAEQLWPTTNVPIATPQGGRDGGRTGLLTSSLGLSTDWEDWVSRVWTRTDAGSFRVSSTTEKQNPATGEVMRWSRIMPNEGTASEREDAAVWEFVTKSGRTMSADLSVQEYGLPARVPVGSMVDVWDPNLGFYDRSNPTTFRGDTIYPVRIRVTASDWPVQQGMGVWLDRRNITGDPDDLVDLTPHIEFASADADTTLTLGRPPEGIGRRR